MTQDDLSEIRRRALKFGAANCWTGESGRMAVDVFTLLDEVALLTSGTWSHSMPWGDWQDNAKRNMPSEVHVVTDWDEAVRLVTEPLDLNPTDGATPNGSGD